MEGGKKKINLGQGSSCGEAPPPINLKKGEYGLNFNIQLNWLHRVTMCYLVNAKHTHARTLTLTKTGQRRPNK